MFRILLKSIWLFFALLPKVIKMPFGSTTILDMFSVIVNHSLISLIWIDGLQLCYSQPCLYGSFFFILMLAFTTIFVTFVLGINPWLQMAVHFSLLLLPNMVSAFTSIQAKSPNFAAWKNLDSNLLSITKLSEVSVFCNWR